MARSKTRLDSSALKALLGEALPDADPPAADPSEKKLLELPLEVVDPNPWQPRQDFSAEELDQLAESLRTYGQRSPVEVRPHPGQPGRYQLISGERRLRACKQAGLPTVRAILVAEEDSRMLRLALVENLQREDLNPMDQALGLHRLMEEFQLIQEELAQQVSMARATVANLLRLLKLPLPVQNFIRSGQLSQGQAKLLLSLPSEVARKLAEQAVSEQLSVAQLQELVRKAQACPKPAEDKPEKSKSAPSPTSATERDPFLAGLEAALRDHFGSRCWITAQPNYHGTIHIEYYGLESMDGILERMGVKLPV